MDAEALRLLHTTSDAKGHFRLPRELNYPTLFWLFLFGSVAGFVLEGLWCILTKGHWEHHAATVWGPFCIIYGFGAAAVYILSIFLRGRPLLLQFGAFSFAGGLVEYFGSLLQELCFGTVSWDYSQHLFNLGGRVSLKMALLWGVLGIAFLYLAFPLLRRLMAKMKGRGWRVACIALTLFMAVNLLVTSAAISRWRTRPAQPAETPFAQWLDNTYDDETMARLFPNMRISQE